MVIKNVGLMKIRTKENGDAVTLKMMCHSSDPYRPRAQRPINNSNN